MLTLCLTPTASELYKLSALEGYTEYLDLASAEVYGDG